MKNNLYLDFAEVLHIINLIDDNTDNYIPPKRIYKKREKALREKLRKLYTKLS